MKTAVGWLIEQLDIDLIDNDWAIEQAKEMEKQQIEDAYSNGRVDEQFKGTGASFYITKAEQYYNEKFNK
jgi:shikimate kinase